jgi:hypothetical protein
VNDLGKKSQAFYETTNEILDAWCDSEAYHGLTKEQLFGEGAVVVPAGALWRHAVVRAKTPGRPSDLGPCE